MEAQQRIDDLIVISTGLAELLERENDSLRRHDRKAVVDMLDDKRTLCLGYQSRISTLTENADWLKGVPPEQRIQLRSAGDQVKTLMEENALLLKAAMAANRRVVDLVVDAVKEISPGGNAYSPTGSRGTGKRGPSPHSVPISINKTL